MRTERNKDGSFNVWMSRREYENIPRTANNWHEELAIRIMGECGLRVGEVVNVEPGDISRMSDGEHHKLTVHKGKDTTGDYDGGKHREAWIPDALETDIYRYVQERHIESDELLFPVTDRTVKNWVKRAAQNTASRTGDTDYKKVSSHDLRRSWAHYLLVEQKINPRIVMALGGWSSYDAIEPYLNKPSESNIIDAMSAVDL